MSKRHPYPPTKTKRQPPYWVPLWYCLNCGALVPRAEATSHVLDNMHSLVPAL